MTKEQVEALKAAGISESAIIDRILEEAAPRPEKPDTEEKKPAEEKKTKPAEEKKTKPAQDPAPEKKPEQEKKTEPEPEKKSGSEDRILAAIEKLTGAVLTHNIKSIGREDSVPDDADKIIGALLRGEPPKTN